MIFTEVGVIVISTSSDSKIATRALLSSLYPELLFVAGGVWAFDNIGVVDSKGGDQYLLVSLRFVVCFKGGGDSPV